MTARSIYVEPQFKRIDLPMMIRVNPLAPPTIPKRTVSMQTIKATDHNKLRALRMQREELARYHAIWSEPVYGDRKVIFSLEKFESFTTNFHFSRNCSLPNCVTAVT